MKTIHIKNHRVGRGEPLYLIAEMACAHDGDKDKAFRLVDAAVKSGADAVQLQFFVTDELVTPDHPIHDVLRRIEFSQTVWEEIYRYARKFSLDVFVCAFDVPSAQRAIELGADGIKLNSSDLMNPSLLDLVAASGLPFTLGTGASEIDEIAQAVKRAESAGARDMVIMHGVQNFPTKVENAHIWKVRLLDDLFPYPVGYADHTDASLDLARHVDLIAVGAGATLLEKHVTLDRGEKGVDYQAALEPKELAKWVSHMRQSETARGSAGILPLSDSDREYRRFQKKSVVAAQDLEPGKVLTSKDVRFLRCAGDPGIPPMNMNALLGRTVYKTVAKYQKIDIADLKVERNK
jgi:sialic acid synthase SpsE